MQGKLGIIVQTRMSSSRFPGKSLMNIGEEPLIFYVVNHLKLTGLPVVVCTSDQSSDDPLFNYLNSINISVFRGDLANVLDRYLCTAQEFGFERIVRVTGDNPLVDTEFLMESLPLFDSFDYVDGIYPQGLIKGIGFEFVTLKELMSIPSKREIHQEHVTTWLRENLKESNKRIQLKPDEELKYRNDIFLTCDYPEDLEFLKKIFSHFNFRIDIKTHEVVEFLNEYPFLKEINRYCHSS